MMDRLSILGLTKYDPNVWRFFQVPPGLVKQYVQDTICLECAELGLVYTEPDTVQLMIKLWVAKELPGWIRMQDALTEQYNPIHNYDRYEDWTDTGSASATGQNTTKVAGFNQSSGLANRDQSDQSTSSSSSGTHKGHLYGNIGVTSSQEMVTRELELRQKTMTDIIVQSFKNQFCIQIY